MRYVQETTLNHICLSDRGSTICCACRCGYPSKELILFHFCHHFLFNPFVKQIHFVWICFCALTVWSCTRPVFPGNQGSGRLLQKCKVGTAPNCTAGKTKKENGGELSAQLFVWWKNVLAGSVVQDTGPSVEKEACVIFPRGKHFLVALRFFFGAARICCSSVDCAENFLDSFFVFFWCALCFFVRNAFFQPLHLPRAHSRLYSTIHRSSTARGHVPPFFWSATLNRPWSTLQ